MTGIRNSLAANIGQIIKIGAVKRRILQTIILLLFTVASTAQHEATHWLPIPKEESFSVAELKMYYHNLAMVGRFLCALGLDPNHTKNNPEIIKNL
jgi:hypothetical protein